MGIFPAALECIQVSQLFPHFWRLVQLLKPDVAPWGDSSYMLWIMGLLISYLQYTARCLRHNQWHNPWPRHTDTDNITTLSLKVWLLGALWQAALS